MIVLTGGAGFIGSCILGALNNAGRDDILIVDSLRTGSKWKNLVGHSFIDIVSKEDFRDRILMDEFEGVDVVIHMGACSATTETDADYLYDNNYRYSTEVAEFAMDHDARFIYASSAATYGAGENGYNDAETDLYPLNMYGFSKHLFDLWIREQGLDNVSVGLKFFNVFGPNEYHKGGQASMVYKAFNQMKETGTIRLFKSNDTEYQDGGQLRDFIYIKDVVDIVMRLVDDGSVNGIYNVGTGNARSWNDLASAVCSALGAETRITYVDMPADIAKQYQNYTKADMDRLKGAIPGVSFTSLESAIADYVNGYLNTDRPYFKG